VIRSFRSKTAEALFRGNIVPELQNLRAVSLRKLDMLNSAANLGDLRAPPANRLEALVGIERVSTALGSTINFVFVSYGPTLAPSKSKSSITIEKDMT
jgi:hypothetical protein